MNQYLGLKWFIISIVFFTIATPSSAFSVLGVLSLFQWCPMDATEKLVHGGLAQIISGTKGTLSKSKSKILQTWSIFSKLLLSVV